MAPQPSSALSAIDSRSLHDEAVKEVPTPPISATSAVPEPPASGPTIREAAPARPALDDDWPTLAVLSRRYIGRALEHTSGNKTRAADLLGIDRRTLNRILARERARQAASAAKATNGAAPAAR